MVLGALLDAGLDKARLMDELKKLNLPDWKLLDQHVQRGPLRARHVDFEIEDRDNHHAYVEIDNRIASANLPDQIRDMAQALFKRLAEAEAHVHGVPIKDVEFHEVGASDSLLDLVGASVAFDLLAIDHVTVSPINVGGGSVMTAHGQLPVPAPATAQLLAHSSAVAYGSEVDFELLTPTGAVILTHVADAYGPLPTMRINHVGYGAGTADLTIPNMLCVTLGTSHEGHESDMATVIETNIDDMNPELYTYVSERLFAAGALDVWTAPIVMKKGRPGTQLAVLAKANSVRDLINLILTETTTLGVRVHEVHRTTLPRKSLTVETQYGRVRVKASYQHGSLRDVAPEATDCGRIASEYGVAWREVYDAARLAGLASAPNNFELSS